VGPWHGIRRCVAGLRLALTSLGSVLAARAAWASLRREEPPLRRCGSKKAGSFWVLHGLASSCSASTSSWICSPWFTQVMKDWPRSRAGTRTGDSIS
jgi:hypothetical protein